MTKVSQEPGSFRPKFPFHMVWLATNACNARCLHCSSNSSSRTPDELTRAEVFCLIDQLHDCGVVDLAVSGGEPILRKDLFRIISYAKLRGFSVGVGSNGTTLTPAHAKRFAELQIDRYQVSLDGLASSHDTLRCWPGMFERVIKTIQLARENGLRTHICCTINRLNYAELASFTKFASELDVQRINFSRYVPTGRGSDSLDLTTREWQDVIHLCVTLRKRHTDQMEIVTHLAQQILVDKQVTEMPGFVGCQAGIGQGCVSANGTVYPCVLLPIAIGNVRDKPFREIWQGSPLIRAFQARDCLNGECGSCRLKNRCGGCRAVAFAKTGDPLASDPRCWLISDPAVSRFPLVAN